ncbi:MAG TPA: DUF971 domain-containing protein [Pirellulales bacterium]|jgi:DUF971 family protein|nr:DUF971 domain-containing protein [Pirellulales bacterium]
MSSMSPQPIQLSRSGDNAIVIHWSDGGLRQYSFRELRDACPCATCREKRSAVPEAANLLPVLSASEARPLQIAKMEPVGNYAYSIEFSDGHNTGIYTLDLLRQLGHEAPGKSA